MKDPNAADLDRARILGETARIAWAELQRFFAGGRAIYVSADLDLVETAYQLSRDDASSLKAWLTDGKVDKVSDAQALEWLEADAIVWAVVVKPWVLVQPIEPDEIH